MTTKSSKLKIAEISDIHLGHPTTPTTLILRNLRAAFPDNEKTGELDMIIFGGDVFDRLLTVPDDVVAEIRTWINLFLRMCVRRDIVVRILEGTPSHDWRQSKMFIEINENSQIGTDCKYIHTLSIDIVERFGMSFLYVPDEWRPSPDQTWREVQVLLKQHGLKKVDFAVMHGFFPHQLPDHLVPGAHDPERYLSIVEYAIFIGHVHKFSNYERIWAGGSFDRIAHSEEEAKGHLHYTLDGDKQNVMFVENRGAMIYKSIQCKDADSEQILKMVEEGVKDLPEGSAVRLVSKKGDVAAASLKFFKEKYPQFKWTSKIDSGKSAKHVEDIDLKLKQHKMIKVTKDNIVPLIEERIHNRYPDHEELILKELKGVVNGPDVK